MTLTAGAISRVTDIEAAILTTGTYTPLVTANAGVVTVGATGFSTGSYARIGRMIWAWIDLRVEGAGSSIAGTSWRITVPYLADLSVHTANVLNAASHNIGSFQSRSGTAAQSTSGGALLSGPSGTDTTGTALIFYPEASFTSVGAANFTTMAGIKAQISYVADASMTLVV